MRPSPPPRRGHGGRLVCRRRPVGRSCRGSRVPTLADSPGGSHPASGPAAPLLVVSPKTTRRLNALNLVTWPRRVGCFLAFPPSPHLLFRFGFLFSISCISAFPESPRWQLATSQIPQLKWSLKEFTIRNQVCLLYGVAMTDSLLSGRSTRAHTYILANCDPTSGFVGKNDLQAFKSTLASKTRTEFVAHHIRTGLLHRFWNHRCQNSKVVLENATVRI